MIIQNINAISFTVVIELNDIDNSVMPLNGNLPTKSLNQISYNQYIQQIEIIIGYTITSSDYLDIKLLLNLNDFIVSHFLQGSTDFLIVTTFYDQINNNIQIASENITKNISVT